MTSLKGFASQLTEKFGTDFSVTMIEMDVKVRWLDGPSAVQVREFLSEFEYPEEVTENHEVKTARAYSSAALKAGWNKLGRMTELPETTPRIVPSPDGYGSMLKSNLEVEVNGKKLLFPIAVLMVLDDEDLTVSRQVKAYEYSTWKGNFKVSMTTENGTEVSVVMGPKKVQMMLASAPEMQQYLADVDSGKIKQS